MGSPLDIFIDLITDGKNTEEKIGKVSKIRGAIPELIIFIFSLILTVVGVPSVINIATQILHIRQINFPISTNMLLTILFRLFGWFLTFEAGYRIAHRWRRGKYSR